MQIHEMIEAMIERIEGLDPDVELPALREHVGVSSPIAMELLAYEHLSSPVQEARRTAAIQLRVVVELGRRLRWLERACVDPQLAPGLRAALAGLLRGLCNPDELAPALDSQAAVLLEPALLFHELLGQLRPWLPPLIVALEPEPVLELLRLGIPDYLHALLRARFEALWALFHGLRQLPPARLAVLAEPPAIDDERLSGLGAFSYGWLFGAVTVFGGYTWLIGMLREDGSN